MCTYNAISSHTDHFEIQKKRFRRKSFILADNADPGGMLFCAAFHTSIQYLPRFPSYKWVKDTPNKKKTIFFSQKVPYESSIRALFSHFSQIL